MESRKRKVKLFTFWMGFNKFGEMEDKGKRAKNGDNAE
jgi:hypothetical protein